MSTNITNEKQSMQFECMYPEFRKVKLISLILMFAPFYYLIPADDNWTYSHIYPSIFMVVFIYLMAIRKNVRTITFDDNRLLNETKNNATTLCDMESIKFYIFDYDICPVFNTETSNTTIYCLGDEKLKTNLYEEHINGKYKFNWILNFFVNTLFDLIVREDKYVFVACGENYVRATFILIDKEKYQKLKEFVLGSGVECYRINSIKRIERMTSQTTE